MKIPPCVIAMKVAEQERTKCRLWLPLFILWLGIFEESKVTLIAVGVFFPVYLGVMGAFAEDSARDYQFTGGDEVDSASPVIMVDDVWTSGQTLWTAYEHLKALNPSANILNLGGRRAMYKYLKRKDSSSPAGTRETMVLFRSKGS
jgi:hypothetical protein